MKDAPESWWFEFVALPDGVPENHRYRHLLKIALRQLGLKCKRVCSVPPANLIEKETNDRDENPTNRN